jgi:predicted RNA-binding protein YlqC (UPF0109 family)
MIKELLHQILESIVDYPEKININEIVSTQSVVLELAVAKSDMGKVIGKKGKTVTAIRTLLNAAAIKMKKRLMLELLE